MLFDILAFRKELAQTLHTLQLYNTTSTWCFVFFNHDLRLLLGVHHLTLERFTFVHATATLMTLSYIARHG